MRLPRFRFTIRRMMIVVAVVAILFWAIWLGARIHAFRWMAKYHEARRWTQVIDTTSRGIDSRGEVISSERDRWHAALAAKYDHAARYPWLSVEPDPIEPK
jgi:hypothetical protein